MGVNSIVRTLILGLRTFARFASRASATLASDGRAAINVDIVRRQAICDKLAFSGREISWLLRVEI
jgi:hypothetical protein